jgi:hypothetical protein
MSHSLGPSYEGDSVDKLYEMINHYEDSPNDKTIIRLAQEIISKLQVAPSLDLLARVEVMIFPKMENLGVKEESTGLALAILCEVVAEKESAIDEGFESIDQTRLDQERIKAKIEKCLKDPGSFEIFLSDEETGFAFASAAIHKVASMIESHKLITEIEVIFLSYAVELFSNASEAAITLEILRIKHPEVSHLAKFIELEERVLAKDRGEHSGEIWDCVASYFDPKSRGFLYEFTLKPEYQDEALLESKFSEIFPAIEVPPTFALTLFGGKRGKRDKFMKFLSELGYSATKDSAGVHLFLPDRNFLMDRYKQLKDEKDLPEISIKGNIGITPDIDFCKVYLMHDAILSEFIHDHTAHIIAVLSKALLGKESFEAIRKRDREFIKEKLAILERVEQEIKKGSDSIFGKETEKMKKHFPVIQTLLGALVDNLASMSDASEDFLTEFSEILEDDRWVAYLEKRYDEEKTLDGGVVLPKFDKKIIQELVSSIEKAL